MGRFNPVKAITALFSCVSLLFGAFGSFDSTVAENIAYQDAHMAYLENEYYNDYTPVDESKIAGFYVEEAIANGVKYNEVSFIGTHNSYKAESPEEYKKLFAALSDATFGIVDSAKTDFHMDTLTDQLELGVRSVEIDIETVVKNGEASFVVCHSPMTDAASVCYDFAKMLQEIKLWSDHNPNHLPISIIIEPKKSLPPIRNLKNFSLTYAKQFDAVIREVLGDTLLTPADMMGDHADFKEMRENNDWLPLGETMGKVLVLLHDTTVTSDYIQQDTTLRSQAMFPMLRYDDRNKSYAAFIIDNTPDTALKHKEESIDRCRLIVRTRADEYLSYSDAKYQAAINSGAQIISTDYPPTTFEKENTFTFQNGYMIKMK